MTNTAFDDAKLQRELSLGSFEHHAVIDSTQNRAKVLAERLNAALPALIVADEQTAGRGRGSNRWWASAGALTFSYVEDAAKLGTPPERLPSIALAAGLAIESEIRSIVGDGASGVKWPNDVYLEGKKIAGVLIESMVVGSDWRVVIGVGLNVNNSLSDGPDEIAATATSLADYTQRTYDLQSVLTNVVKSLQAELRQHARQDARQCELWNQRSLLKDRTIVLEVAEELVRGRCVGIDTDGALLLEQEGKIESCVSGVIREIKPPL